MQNRPSPAQRAEAWQRRLENVKLPATYIPAPLKPAPPDAKYTGKICSEKHVGHSHFLADICKALDLKTREDVAKFIGRQPTRYVDALMRTTRGEFVKTPEYETIRRKLMTQHGILLGVLKQLEDIAPKHTGRVIRRQK